MKRIGGTEADKEAFTTALADRGCRFWIDLTSIESSTFCPLCHNFSLQDHGPAFPDDSSPWTNLYYETQADLARGNSSGIGYALMQESQLPDDLDSYSCRYCLIVELCRRYVVQSSRDDGVDAAYSDGWLCQVLLQPDSNIRLHITIYSGEGEKDMRFELYTTQPPYIAHGQGKGVNELSPDCGAENLDFLRRRLENCQSNHTESCRNPEGELWPSRLLSIKKTESIGDTPEVAIVSTDTLSKGKIDYIALSHCWGTLQPTRTLTSNIAEFSKRIDHDSLPVLFQNAITVARDLGVHFLWIDSLCIIQDSAEDWALESPKMGEIYSNAFLTISAARSENSSQPILGPDAVRDCSHLEFVLSGPDDRRSSPSVLRARTMPQEIYDLNFAGPLASRAWAYQESVSSRRIASFTAHEIIWLCPWELRYQSRQGSYRRSRPGVPRIEDYKLWHKHVEDYSARMLTVFTDKLPAISGLGAQMVKQQVTEHKGRLGRGVPTGARPGSGSNKGPLLIGIGETPVYLAGLWLHSLRRDLAWQRSATNPLSGSDFVPDLGCFTAPTWSWASLNGKVSWFDDRKVDVSDKQIISANVVEVLDHVVEAATANPYGQVKDNAYITLRGRMIEINITLNYRPNFNKYLYRMTLPTEDLLAESTEADVGWASVRAAIATLDRDPHPTRKWTQHRVISVANRGRPIQEDCALFPRDIGLVDQKVALTRARSSAEALDVLQKDLWPAKAHCILLLATPVSATALILGPSQTRPGAFERLGLTRWDTSDDDWPQYEKCFNQADPRQIVLV